MITLKTSYSETKLSLEEFADLKLALVSHIANRQSMIETAQNAGWSKFVKVYEKEERSAEVLLSKLNQL